MAIILAGDAAVLSVSRRLRDLPGVLLKDLPRYRRALANSGPGHRSDPNGWISLCNRGERLVADDSEPGLRCDWWSGSTLHAPSVLARLGQRMMAAALSEWPVEFVAMPRLRSAEPQVSFVFTHAGEDRLPLLLKTIESINAQRDVGCECIVVDQSARAVATRFPEHVRHIHLDNSALPQGWRKAWGYNVGARSARADILIFQDGDVCVPTDYAREVCAALRDRGHAAASLQRLLFYLDAPSSLRMGNPETRLDKLTIEAIRQNWKGGTIAIRRDAFMSIGGFDEGFVDWGGEDDEFYDRCAQVGHCRNGYLPFVHLWHEPQAQRRAHTNVNTSRILPTRLGIPRADRAAELHARQWGETERPDPLERYA